ncbi:MAG TPA: adenylate/guanylate cyclase domain-containing protein [Nocardioidaceae bacterium]|nr:adenylate/guanylate cyclase domain-containing protein [Nocardioidaceae bacterium]
MTCVGCGREIPGDAAFCPLCGTAQPAATCQSCAAALIPGAAFCLRCGTPTGAATPLPATSAPGPAASAAPPSPARAATAERRLTSVLFADLVSYTTLSESRDTEDVRELLSRYFDVCATVVGRYGGTIEKFIGDAVMAVWGVPAAHEDDAERAVRAAMELVDDVAELGRSVGLPGLQLRVGVVTGEVAATLGATGQGMVAGDPVNTASRIQATAGAGEVWVDVRTRAMTAAAVTYVDMGEHPLKGKAEPVRLFRAGSVVASVGGSQRVDGLEAPLAGRDRELRLVKELFHTTVESGRPKLVVLDGEAGIGKTRLAWEFEKYCSGIETDMFWHRGRCLSYGDGVAYWALAEAVRARLGLVDDDAGPGERDRDPGDTVADRVGAALAGWVPDEAERAWMQPRLAALLGGRLGEFQREDLFSAWTRFFERLGDDAEAVALVFDDAQYADQGLLDFLEHLLTNARTAVFVLLLARPELGERHPQLGGRRATTVPLEPLPDAAMDTLVAGLVENLPDEARRSLVARSEGVPLFAVETVRALIDRELVQPVGGRYVVAPGQAVDLSTIEAPASLHALVAARLDALTPDERRVIGDASVLGALFTREGIGMLAADVGDLDAVLAGLQRKELIATETDRFSAERGQFRFVQAVVRQVAYATLSRRDRKSRHLLVAGRMAAEIARHGDLAQVAAQHLIDALEASGADDPDVTELQARAADLLVTAGERAARLGSHADALRAYREAAGRMSAGAGRAQALYRAARAAEDSARYTESMQLAEEALAEFAEVGDSVGAGRAAAELAICRMVVGDATGAATLARSHYEALADQPGAEQVRAELAVTLARSLVSLGSARESLAVIGEALWLAEMAGDAELLTRAMSVLATYNFSHGSSRVALAISREIVDIAATEGLWRQLFATQVNLALLLRLRNLTECRQMIRQASETMLEHGLSRTLTWANLSTVSWSVGDWIEHEQLVREVAEADTLPAGDMAIVYATELWRRSAGPAPILTRPDGTSDDLNFLGWDAHIRALEALEIGDGPLAAEFAVKALEHAVADAGMTDDYVAHLPRMVRVAVAAGEPQTARAMIEQVEASPRGLVSPALRAYESALRGLVGSHLGGDAESVESDLRDGVAALTAYGAVPDRALAQEDLGSWLIEQGRHAEAAELLRAARTTYTELGATAWLERLTRQSAAPAS